ncbi:hypothetical protein OMP44_14880 [Pseudomonas sp. CBMAI 2609]|uniref:Transcription regulator HTH AraC- type ligand binding domain-containing protein n=1 Tax=Pseudomonas flavocrustae TaxID=2991719 RepID=A0ABT6IJF9_9PSED|nr:hypothetical protein [Pseudomonas sp. CBMAI 2609]MDH4764174.1 hypothetical protein [Pseudomonas sp. CBMAI 2609]
MTQQVLLHDFADWTQAAVGMRPLPVRLGARALVFHRQDLAHLHRRFEDTTININAAHIACERPLSDQVDDRTCFLIVQKAERSVLRHQGEAVQFRPGDIALMCPEFGCDILTCVLIRHTSFHLDRQAQGRRLARGDPRFGKLPNSGLTTPLLRSLVS